MTANDIIYIIASLLLVPHIAYGGYFIIKKLNKFDFIVLALGLAVAVSQVAMLLNVFRPVDWFIWLVITFLFAVPFHTRIRMLADRISLQEFCNYKIYIEVYGIILSILGIGLITLLPTGNIIPGLLTVVFILRLNWLIFAKKDLYRLDFPNPSHPHEPLVSIVIIAYNEQHYIGKTLESIRNQSYKNFEVILVDDRSEDDTVKIASGYHDFFPLKIMQKEVRGCSRSRNFGATHAAGDIILFIDADVLLPPEFLEKGLHEFSRQHLSCAFFDFKPITTKKIDLLISSVYRRWLKITQHYNPRAIGSCIMVKKDVHHKTLFDTTVVMAEDFDYVRRAVKLGKFRIIEEPKYLLSWRRFEAENRFWLVVKYLLFEAYRQNIGEIRKPILKYRFGHYKK